MVDVIHVNMIINYLTQDKSDTLQEDMQKIKIQLYKIIAKKSPKKDCYFQHTVAMCKHLNLSVTREC